MYTIRLDEAETRQYRTGGYHKRYMYQREADSQMASRLEAVEIVAADGAMLYRNSQYKGAVSDQEWYEAQHGD